MKKILFLCVANSARSQMAEGLARKLLPKNYIIHSADSKPTPINPFAIQAMDEICPFVTSNAMKLHWPFPDPENKEDTQQEALIKFKKTRNEIEQKIKSYFSIELSKVNNV
jgi:arsenate reductase (thioredoxin)